MRFPIVAAFALAAASSLQAQDPAPAIADQSQATPLPGNWTYAPTGDGSQAVFADANNQPQLAIRCVRAIRRVIISKPAALSTPSLSVWSSTATKSFSTTFDSATARLSIQIANWDPMLDAIALSRGRFAVAAGAQAPLVVPAWSEISRIVEDCRA